MCLEKTNNQTTESVFNDYAYFVRDAAPYDLISHVGCLAQFLHHVRKEI